MGLQMWNHASCIIKKSNQIKSVDDVEAMESLRWDDQQKLRKYIEEVRPSKTAIVSSSESGIEVSQTSRATCKRCSQKIVKGEEDFENFWSECPWEEDLKYAKAVCHQAASLDAIASLVKKDVLTVETLVKEMEMYLTTTDVVIRARGTSKFM